ncbi:MAG: GNAT family N-acetyltransferase [Caldilineaceae bacterium]|nr:GNAT family N-acetyltransferase [Caldilineaceae bacterium]
MPESAWMAIQINTLFQRDDQGRLHLVNEPGPPGTQPPAPRFFLGRTPTGHYWRFRADLPAALVAELEEYCRAEPLTNDLQPPPRAYAAIKALLQAHAPLESEYRGPAYWVPAGIAPALPVVLINEETLPLTQRHFPWVTPTDPYYTCGPMVAVLADGHAVTLCFCSRTPGQATEAGLETAAAYRGRGYAAAAVAGWAAAVRQQGCLPLYSTAWDNVASQRVAAKLGLVCYGEDWSLS